MSPTPTWLRWIARAYLGLFALWGCAVCITFSEYREAVVRSFRHAFFLEGATAQIAWQAPLSGFFVAAVAVIALVATFAGRRSHRPSIGFALASLALAWLTWMGIHSIDTQAAHAGGCDYPDRALSQFVSEGDIAFPIGIGLTSTFLVIWLLWAVPAFVQRRSSRVVLLQSDE